MIAMIAPLGAQLMMMTVMLADGRWMFALMVVPGAIGCAAMLVASAITRKRRRSGIGSGAGAGYGEAAGSGEPGVSDGRGAAAVDFSSIRSRSLMALMNDEEATDPLLWRTIVRWWLAPPSMDAPLGMSHDGTFRLDLTRRGPHALVAGTTGSGKSVLLQIWCAYLACRNPPSRLNFVFLDFKGGSAFSGLEHLPHTVGCVSDLNLRHAVRALEALEQELRRREHLVAAHRTSDINGLTDPPPRLMVVVDEFHALRSQLPDYVERLVRVAALGRSLGMHLIACTQNPMGQISADMKANIAVSICLRVRDGMQSAELIGDGRAAAISPALPGAAYCHDGESASALRCASAEAMSHIVDAIGQAATFHGMVRSRPLFTPPLPRTVERLPCDDADDMGGTSDGGVAGGGAGRNDSGHGESPSMRGPDAASGSDAASGPSEGGIPPRTIPFSLGDTGIGVFTAHLPLDAGGIGIIGPTGRGKSTLIRTLAQQLLDCGNVEVTLTTRESGEYVTRRLRRRRDAMRSRTRAPACARPGPCPQPPRIIWLLDDADDLFDPFCEQATAQRLRDAFADRRATIIFAVHTSRHLRVPEHCATRIVFPTGERANDLMNGVSAQMLSQLDADDLATPGRAVLVLHGRSTLIQCPSPRADSSADSPKTCTLENPWAKALEKSADSWLSVL